MAPIQIATYYLWLLGAVIVVVAQLREDQPEENHYSYNQVSPANHPKNPWANYHHQIQRQPWASAFSNVDRQGILRGILNNPEAVGIVAVAAGGAVALGAIALRLEDARETDERLSQRQAQICSDGKTTADQLTTVARQIIALINDLPGFLPAATATEIESVLEPIISSGSSINC